MAPFDSKRAGARRRYLRASWNKGRLYRRPDEGNLHDGNGDAIPLGQSPRVRLV